MALNKSFFLLISLLILICSTTAVPTTRILKSTFHHPSDPQDFNFQDVRDLEMNGGDSIEGRLLMFEGRMILENNDYPGTGANNHHDPKTPAKP